MGSFSGGQGWIVLLAGVKRAYVFCLWVIPTAKTLRTLPARARTNDKAPLCGGS